MLKYIFKRLIALIPVLVGVAFIVFTLLFITPGDPARMALGDQAPQSAVEEFREKSGLNDPFFMQFGRYLYKAVVKQDLGNSYITKGPVINDIKAAFPNTFKLALFSICIAIVFGIPFGIISAIKQYSIFDTVTMVFAMIGLSMPVFWLGLLLILLFSVRLKWLPASGFSSFRQMILPSVSLSAQAISIITRMTRSSMLEVIRQDYIRTARAKGQTESKIIWRHALPNALIPVVTIVGLQFGGLLGGAILTETIFAVPGVGQLMVNAIKSRDYPMVQGGVLFVAVAFSLVNLLVDLLYAFIDPRIKAEYK